MGRGMACAGRKDKQGTQAAQSREHVGRDGGDVIPIETLAARGWCRVRMPGAERRGDVKIVQLFETSERPTLYALDVV